MTKQECAVIQAYTGEKMLSDNDTYIFYNYIAYLLDKHGISLKGESIPEITRKLTTKDNGKVLKTLAEEDFNYICSSAFDFCDVADGLNDFLLDCDHDDCCHACSHTKNDGPSDTFKEIMEGLDRIDQSLKVMHACMTLIDY